MRRQLRNIFVVLSLLLCLAACVVWVRSYTEWYGVNVPGKLTYEPASDQGHAGVYHASSRNGGLVVDITTYHFVNPGRTPEMPRFGVYSMSASHLDAPEARRWLGFAWSDRAGTWGGPVARGVPTTHVRVRLLKIPFWLIVSGSLVVPLHCMRVLHRARCRRRAGRCSRCGYDLRASPKRCPECGAVPEPPHNPPMQRTVPAV